MRWYRRLRLRKELWALKKKRTGLAADWAEATYDASPPDFPPWYHQEVAAAGQPLLEGMAELDKKIREIEEQLKS